MSLVADYKLRSLRFEAEVSLVGVLSPRSGLLGFVHQNEGWTSIYDVRETSTS
jgi:hypothetical protein